MSRAGRYADIKRADLRVSYATPSISANVPIEIKRDSHADLWSAIQDQLIRRYTKGLETDGHGIYVVFWFGRHKIPASPSGKKPSTAETLEEQLLQSLTSEQRQLISVVVFDCAAH